MTVRGISGITRGWLVGLIALAASAGCAGRSVPIDHDVLSTLKAGGPLKVIRHQPPAFAVKDPPNSRVESLVGVSGGDLVIPGRPSQMAPMEEEYALDDPAIAVRAKLLDALAFELGVSHDASEGPPLTDDNLDALPDAVGREGWLLDVKTVRWGIAYDGALWTRYRVQVETRGRLIDLSRRQVAWQATCDGSERDAPKKSGFADLTSQDATALKERLSAAADRCSEALIQDIFHGVR